MLSPHELGVCKELEQVGSSSTYGSISLSGALGKDVLPRSSCRTSLLLCESPTPPHFQMASPETLAMGFALKRETEIPLRALGLKKQEENSLLL